MHKHLLNELKPEDGPCYGCPLYDGCYLQALACDRFAEYVATGRYLSKGPRVPTRELYRHVFEELDFDEKAKGM